MGIINDVNSLEPMTAMKCNQFIRECVKEGINVVINETLREEITHLIYFIQGALADIKSKNPNIYNELNALRKKHKFWDISETEANKRVTWTLNSLHFTGKAFDAAPLNNKGQVDWNPSDETKKKMAECAVRVGLYPGLNFGDWPHFENRG
jgi:hypothetical protein